MPNINLGPLEIDTYNSMYAVGIIGMFLMCFFSHKKYETPRIRAVIYTIITFVFGVAGAKLMGKLYTAVMLKVSEGSYDPNSGVCIFGALVFLPMFMLILAFVSGEKYRKLMDYMTPGIFFILACAKFGCMLGGCCYGIADENGIYNHNLDYTVFPVQLYESICTFAVVAILIVIMILRKGNSPRLRYGSLYPVGTILYCSARFFWENYRHYEQVCESEFLFGLTFWQSWAVLCIIMSVVWLIVLYSVKSFSECELLHKKDVVRNEANAVMNKMTDKASASADKKRKRHADKAKEHAKKAKELKRK